MKHLNINIKVVGLLFCIAFMGCSKILEEHPKSIFTPEYFKTQQGVMGGITQMYAHLRNMYGQAYYYNACETGTDEATYGQQADQNFKVMDMTGQGEITSTTSRADVIWGNCFTNINTASGVLEYGPQSGIGSDILAEARFFRAFDYFLLVQTFGGVPLDLGGGALKFNSNNPYRVSVRNTVPEVYTKAIFPDLDSAINLLPDAPRVTGAATKTLARLYLAKAYLTYGWWLKNPNNIPTYPDTVRVDPDGHNAAWYFQQAYNVAKSAIENPGPFGLEASYYDVNVATNDRNKEILLYADHTEQSEYYNGGSLSYGSGGAPDNFASWMLTWNYPSIQSSTSASSWSAINSVQRAATQPLGRPWVRMAPTIEVITNTFADKVNDSRYDGTFTTVYRCNKDEAGLSNDKLYNANFLPIGEGSAVLTFLNQEPEQTIDYSNAVYKSNIGAGVLPGRSDFVVSPEGISRIIYPGIWKLGPYRTDNNGGLGQPNAGSTRPFNIAKFSELFFIAAEAAVEGALPSAIGGVYANDGTARGLINIIRARAGKWTWSNSGDSAITVDHSAEMIEATPANITIDYLLQERSREYYGEGYRWYDLVRTQEWSKLAASYTICGSSYSDHTPKKYTRNIEPYLYLRPIPQGEIDALQMSDAEKKAYQNPGYE